MSNDLAISIVINAVDLATRDIEAVQTKVQKLRTELNRSEFSRAADGMRKFGESVRSVTTPMAEAAKVGLSLSAALTAVGAALATKVYQSAVEYESAMSGLSKVLDGGAESARLYGEALNQLALKYAQNGQELLGAMTNFVQAGYDAEQAFRLVEESIKLMIAGDLEAAESASNLVAILKGFQAPASEAARAVDIMNEVSNKYATDVKELAAGMAAIAPIARQMGFSLEETAGLLTPIIEVFRSGNEAADALKTGLIKLTDDAKPVRDALEALGVSQTDVNGKLRSGKDIFLDVARAMRTLDDKQRLFYTAQLVGLDQTARVSQVFSNLAGYLAVTSTASQSAGSAINEVAVRLQTAQAVSDRARESFRQLAVTLGNQFKLEISNVVAAAGELAGAFDRAAQGGALDPLLQAIRPQISAIEALLLAMSRNLEGALAGVDWSPLVEGLRDLSGEFGEAFRILTQGYDLSTLEGLRNFIQALINVLGDFSRYVAGVIDGLGPLLSALNTLFSLATNGYPTLSRLNGEMSGLALSANTVGPAISTVASAVLGFTGKVVEIIAQVALFAAALRILAAAGIPVVAMLTGLVARIGAMSPILVGVLASMTGLSGGVLALGAAATALGVGLGLLLSKLVDVGTEALYAKTGIDLLGTAAQSLAEKSAAESAGKLAAKLAEISAQTGVTVTSMDQLERAVRSGLLVQDQVTGAWSRGTEAMQRQAATANLLSNEVTVLAVAQQRLAEAQNRYMDATRAASAGDQAARASLQSLGIEVLKAQDAVDKLARSGRSTGELANGLDQAAASGANLSNSLTNIEPPVEVWHGVEKVTRGVEDLNREIGQTSRDPIGLQVDASQVDEARTKIGDLQRDTSSRHTITSNIAAVLAEISKLQKNTSSTHTVYVKKVERNAAGGWIDPVSPARFATGGEVLSRLFPRARFTTVPGTGNRDTVPAALAPGSYVLRKAAARYYGPRLLDLVSRFANGGQVASLLTPGERLFRPGTVSRLGVGFLDQLNTLQLPREALRDWLTGLAAPVSRFAAGGAVSLAPSAGSTLAGLPEMAVNLRVQGGEPLRLYSSRDTARQLAIALQALERGRG